MASAAARYGGRHDFDAIVVGSGIGGLGAASLLSRRGGMRVAVLERHHTAGGFTHTFRRPGFEWDVGVHYVGEVASPASPVRRLLDGVTATPVAWADLGEVYDVVQIGGRRFSFRRGRGRLHDDLVAAFPSEAPAVRAYFALLDRVSSGKDRYFGERLLPVPLPGAADGLAARRRALRRGFGELAERSTQAVLDSLGAGRELAALLAAQWGNYGLPPAESSFALHAMLASHYLEGAAYPVGGAAAIAAAIAPVVQGNGGVILAGAAVSAISIEDGAARGVELADGRRFSAPIVVSDVGFLNTFGRLLPESAPGVAAAREAGARIGPSCGHLGLYLGLDADAATLGLPRANLWIHPDVDYAATVRSWRAATDPALAAPLFFLSFPSAKDPTFGERYPGRATIEVVTLASWSLFRTWADRPWRRRGDEYAALKRRLADLLVAPLLAAFPQIRGHILVAEVSTPLSTQHFTAHIEGATYGLAPSPERFRESRLGPRTPIRGLYLTGQDVVVPGVGGALAGGYLAAAAILERALFP